MTPRSARSIASLKLASVMRSRRANLVTPLVLKIRTAIPYSMKNYSMESYTFKPGHFAPDLCNTEIGSWRTSRPGSSLWHSPPRRRAPHGTRCKGGFSVVPKSPVPGDISNRFLLRTRIAGHCARLSATLRRLTARAPDPGAASSWLTTPLTGSERRSSQPRRPRSIRMLSSEPQSFRASADGDPRRT